MHIAGAVLAFAAVMILVAWGESPLNGGAAGVMNELSDLLDEVFSQIKRRSGYALQVVLMFVIVVGVIAFSLLFGIPVLAVLTHLIWLGRITFGGRHANQ